MNLFSLRHESGSRTFSPASPCDISVVIPAYCSESTLETLLERILPVLDRLHRSYEVIFVEDGSADGTWSTIESLRNRFPDRIVAVQLMRNYGQHNALMCGFRHARGEFIVTMDDDLQNPPEEIERMIAAIERSDCDLIYGNYAAKQHESFRNLGSSVVNAFYRTVFRTSVTVTSFRVIRRQLLDSIIGFDRHSIFLDGLLAWNTQRIGSVRVAHHPRQQGRSTYSIGKLFSLAMNLFTSFSLLPLQFASVVGVIALFSGFATGVFLFIQSVVTGGHLVGHVSTMAFILAICGIQLMALGVMGEYVGRILLNINGKPQYCERKVLRDVSLASREHRLPERRTIAG